MVQWLRLCLPNAGGLDLVPGQRTRSYMPLLSIHMLQTNKETKKILPSTMKIEDPQCCNTVREYFLKMKDLLSLDVEAERRTPG